MSKIKIQTQYVSGTEIVFINESIDLNKVIGLVLYVTPGLWKIEIIAKYPASNYKLEYGATSETISALISNPYVRILKIIANDSSRFISELSKVIELSKEK